MRFWRYSCGAMLLCWMVQFGYASSISVDPLEVDLSESTRYQDIQVHNVGNDIAYVAVDVARIDHPGEPNQTAVELNDNPYQIGLIVTPSKLVIPVGQTRIIRALYVGKPQNQDVIYRIKVTPVTGQLVALYSGNKALNAGVHVVIAYGIVVYARPVQLEPKVTVLRQGTDLTLTNSGNTSVLIGMCKQCPAGASSCKPLPDLVKRLFPGNQVQVTLPLAAPLKCEEEVLQNQFVPFNID